MDWPPSVAVIRCKDQHLRCGELVQRDTDVRLPTAECTTDFGGLRDVRGGGGLTKDVNADVIGECIGILRAFGHQVIS